MTKWISLALQILMWKKSLTKSASAMEYVERVAEQARGYFLFMVGAIVSAVFLLTSLITAVISVGLQIEQKGEVGFSGLMISASIFLAIALVVFAISSVLLVVQKQKMEERKRLREQQNNSNTMWPLVEEVLKQVLVNLSKPKPAPVKSEES